MKRIFLDYASITPVAKEVSKVMAKQYGNPSALYAEAIEAKEAVAKAKEKIAGVLHCRKDDMVFTSGGTESNNLAVLGIADKNSHIITTAIEHPSISEACRGFDVTILPVDENGQVHPKDVRENLRPNTVLVSVMYANNEIGTIQPIKEIGRIIKEFRAKHNTKTYFHTDACQAALYLPLHVDSLGVDLMTLDGIKMYGPRGMGLLYIRKGVDTNPILFGGGQQENMRSGTEHVAGIVGFAEALEIAEKLKEKESKRLIEIRDYAIEKILKKFPNSVLNGSMERLPNNVNICFPGLDAEFAVIALDVAGIACSYSSSCRTLKEDSSSYVVEALGKLDCKNSSLRFTFGRETKKGDIDALAVALEKIMK